MVDSEKNQRIAVVEDDPGVRTTFVHILQSVGYAVTAFEAGDAFLSHAPRSDFDTIVLDLELPGADGVAVMNHMMDQGSPPPVVVVTGRAKPELLDAAGRYPGVTILRKPVSVDDLIDAVEKSLKQNPAS